MASSSSEPPAVGRQPFWTSLMLLELLHQPDVQDDPLRAAASHPRQGSTTRLFSREAAGGSAPSAGEQAPVWSPGAAEARVPKLRVKDTVMMLTLSEDQARELEAALNLHLQRLEAEISRTEGRTFRLSLRRTFDRLDEVRRQLAMQSPADVHA